MGVLLEQLLPILLTHGYDAVYVLDDASTDNSATIVARYPKVIFMQNKNNKGSGGARNLILEALTKPCIIHFMDADTIPKTHSFPTEIRKLDFSETTGFIGGMVFDIRGEQHRWNYGPQLSLASSLSGPTYTIIYTIKETLVGKSLLKLFKNRPPFKNSAKSASHYWVSESNFIIDSETLRASGGFDENLREHDIQPLAILLQRAGKKNGFVQSIAVEHLDTLNVRPYNRSFKLFRSEWYVIRKYLGFFRWLFNVSSFKQKKQ